MPGLPPNRLNTCSSRCKCFAESKTWPCTGRLALNQLAQLETSCLKVPVVQLLVLCVDECACADGGTQDGIWDRKRCHTRPRDVSQVLAQLCQQLLDRLALARRNDLMVTEEKVLLDDLQITAAMSRLHLLTCLPGAALQKQSEPPSAVVATFHAPPQKHLGSGWQDAASHACATSEARPRGSAPREQRCLPCT